MYVGKRKTENGLLTKKQLVLLYLDQHMPPAQIAKEFNIPHTRILYAWAEQYRKFIYYFIYNI